MFVPAEFRFQITSTIEANFNQVATGEVDVYVSSRRTLLHLGRPVTLHDKQLLSINNNGKRFLSL